MKRIYSEALIVIVFPLGSSKRSIVRMSIIIMTPPITMKSRRITMKRPDHMGADIVPTQSYDESNRSVPATVKNGCNCKKEICEKNYDTRGSYENMSYLELLHD